jgi:hypothetical protein
MKNKDMAYYAKIWFNELVSAEDKLFAILLVVGYSANRAYQIAYSTKANANSAAAMASRKVNSFAVQSALRVFQIAYDGGSVEFPHHLIKN